MDDSEIKPGTSAALLVSMKESYEICRHSYRIVPLAGLVGLMLGLLIGTFNDDSLGFALLRVAGLAIGFAWGARTVVRHLTRAWLQNKLKEVEAEIVAKQEETMAKAKELAAKQDPDAHLPPLLRKVLGSRNRSPEEQITPTVNPAPRSTVPAHPVEAQLKS